MPGVLFSASLKELMINKDVWQRKSSTPSYASALSLSVDLYLCSLQTPYVLSQVLLQQNIRWACIIQLEISTSYCSSNKTLRLTFFGALKKMFNRNTLFFFIPSVVYPTETLMKNSSWCWGSIILHTNHPIYFKWKSVSQKNYKSIHEIPADGYILIDNKLFYPFYFSLV